MEARVFPARAGMSPARIRSALDSEGFPRTRGDEPTPLMFSPHTRGFSPHARG